VSPREEVAPEIREVAEPDAAPLPEEVPPPSVEEDLREDPTATAEPPEAGPPLPTSLPEPTPLPPRSAIGVRVRTGPPAPSAPPPAPPAPTPVASPAPTRPPLVAVASPDPPLVADLPAGTTLALTLAYTIGADGRVLEARVTQGSGVPAQDEATRAFVLAFWRYEPPGSVRRVARRFVFTAPG
jgi:hypothetical protein